MKKFFVAMALMVICVAAAFADDVKLNPADIVGVAMFKSDGVNLRKGPSATDPYLCAVTYGGEMDYSMGDLMWSNQVGRTGKIYKQQSYICMTLPVLERRGDWVKMYYGNSVNSFEVWSMAKFVDITPLSGEFTTRSETNPVWGPNVFTCLPGLNPRCAYYNDGGMEDDPGMYIGKVEAGGKVAVFDIFVPVTVTYNESQPGVKVVKDPEYDVLLLEYGPKFLNEKGNEYSGLNVRALNGATLTELSKYAQKDGPIGIAIIGPDGYVQMF